MLLLLLQPGASAQQRMAAFSAGRMRPSSCCGSNRDRDRPRPRAIEKLDILESHMQRAVTRCLSLLQLLQVLLLSQDRACPMSAPRYVYTYGGP